MRYRRLAESGKLSQFGNAHRTAPFVAQNGQQAQAGGVSKYFKLLREVKCVALAEWAIAQRATLCSGGFFRIAGGRFHEHSIKTSALAPLY